MNEVSTSAPKDDWTLIMLHLLLRPLYTIVLLSVRHGIHGTVRPCGANTTAVHNLVVSIERRDPRVSPCYESPETSIRIFPCPTKADP